MASRPIRLTREFFAQETLIVAERLLGKMLIFNGQRLLINETEAYHGFDDPASHAFRGRTKRSNIMFGEAGLSYVYLIYGMYHCLNIVTESINYPAAVLIRGGWWLNQENQVIQNLNGPGKLCRAFGINLTHNGLDLITHPDFYVEEAEPLSEFITTPRIGIKQGLDKHWRFLLKSLPAQSEGQA